MSLKKISLFGLMVLHLCSGAALLTEGSDAILKPDALRRYVATFNSQRPDDTAEGLPGDGSVIAISNAQASAWMERNVPLFECSDKDIEETYYFRWWTYRKHIWKTPDGFVVTEFLPKVSWSKKYNTINCPVGHQLYEGRWLRDPKIINDYAQFHFGKGGDPGGSSKMYSQWITDGIYAHYLVHADKLFVTGLLDALVKNHEAWKQGNPALHPWQRSRLLDNGLYWQVDSWEGQEFSIGGTGIRPPMNAYMFGEAVAIAKIAELAGRKELSENYQAEAEQLRKQVQDRLWDPDAKFFKVMRHEMAPMNQYSNSVAEACEPGQLVKVREIFGLVPWYFNLPESGRGYEEAWRQLIDPQGFLGSYGPTVTERRHPKFFINAAGCMWCGASWPFSTAQTLTALANVLNNYSQDVVGKKEYFDTLKAYTRSHRLTLDDGRVVSWLDESLNPDTGRWIKVGPFPKTRGRDYNHSTYCDLVITGLVGLRPRADDLVEVNPLVPEGALDYFCLDNIRYHGRNLTIVWDKTGKQYGRGAGLRVLADGQEIAHNETLTRVTGKLPNRYPDQRLPGTAKVIVQGNTRRLQNDQVSFQFDVTNGQVKDVRFEIKGEPGSTVLINELFALIVDGTSVNASAMKRDVGIWEETIPANSASPRLGDHSSAQSFALTFTAPDDSYRIVWKAILRDESNYILFDVMVTPLRGDLGLNRLTLLDVTAKNMKQMGTPAGSPVVNDRFFFGYHHPTTRSLIAGDHLTFYWDRSNMAVKKGESVHQRAVIGIYPKDQLRRAFNYYLERERSQAYHQVLHYNAWYDILHTARMKKADEAEALQRIEIFTKELTVKRGVPVKSFMFDDPWDNVSGTATDVWQFDPKRNPNEWKVMKEVAQKHGSALGVWMSPQGGWGGRQVRLATAQKNSLPYVIKDKAFSLSDPAYLARFREVCFDFLRNQGVNMFKFDGFNEQPKNESEREALVKLIEDMRKEKPDVFINTTCGSWPSPFFLMNSDSIWRGGGDIEMKGVGPVREQALTYRDWITYMKVVFQSPLFPISSVMVMGPVLAPYVHHQGFDTATVKEWKHEVRSYFGIGVNLQELYIAPDNPDTGKALMTDSLWDIVAEGARWARDNEDVLVDAHWVGGDPGYGRVYGVASWSPTKATLMLRNPSDQPQSIAIEPEKVFELPAYVMDRTFTLKSPWADEAGKPAITLTAGKIHTFTLEPFEVLVLERK